MIKKTSSAVIIQNKALPGDNKRLTVLIVPDNTSLFNSPCQYLRDAAE